MSACIIEIPISGDVSTMVLRAEQAITSNGGEFTGNISSGSFKISVLIGKIIGEYKINDYSFTINIVEKPFLLSCGRIEDELTKYLSVPRQDNPVA